MFQETEEALNFVALFVEVFIVGALFLPVFPGRDVWNDPVLCGKKANVIAVIPLVGQKIFGFHALNQGDGPRGIMALSGCDDKVQRIAQRIAQPVDFG